MNIDSLLPRHVALRALRGVCLIAAAALVPAASAHAQLERPLSLEQSLELATLRSQRLKADESSARAAREQAVAAGQLPDPTFRLGLNNLPVTGSDRFSIGTDFMTMRSIGVAQEFTREDKRQARAQRFEREAETALAARSVALANLHRDTAIAWLERHFQERLRGLLVAQRDESRLQVTAAEAAYRGGRGSQTDVLAALSVVAQVEDRIRQADRLIEVAATRLERWIGDEAARALAAAPVMDATGLELTALDAQLASHPQLELLNTQEGVARAELDLAQRNRRADWSIDVMVSQRGPAFSNMISINASIPLQWDQTNRQDREVAARMALAEQVRLQREEATRDHVAEVRGWIAQWLGNRDRLARFDDSLIRLAAERGRAALAAYRGGAGTLSAILEARRAEVDIRIERIRLEMETAELWARLKYLIPSKSADDKSRPAASSKE